MIIASNNVMNPPQTLNTNGSLVSSPSGTFRTYSTTGDEIIHGFFLTLKTFGAENYSVGGRGCLNTYGGIIQKNRGAVTQTVSGGGSGYA